MADLIEGFSPAALAKFAVALDDTDPVLLARLAEFVDEGRA